VDFPPNKLKQGFGEHAVFVLDHLADAALKSTNFAWKKYVKEFNYLFENRNRIQF
jgi:estrogen-related receptor beta like 1